MPGDGGQKIAHFNLNVNNAILQVLEKLCQKSFGFFGNIFYQGKTLTKEDTCTSLFVMPNDLLLLQGSSEGGRVTGVVWKRSPNFQHNSYNCGSATCEDAIKFKARRNSHWYGFLWNREYNNKDFIIKVKWRLNEEAFSDWLEISTGNQNLHPDDPDKVFYFDIQDYSAKAIKVDEGSCIELVALCPSGGYFEYIYSGYAEAYKNIAN